MAKSILLFFIIINLTYFASAEQKTGSIYDFLSKIPGLPQATSFSINSNRERRQASAIYSTVAENATKTSTTTVPPLLHNPVAATVNTTNGSTIISAAPSATSVTAADKDKTIPYVTNEQRLLGVNGTGQKKDASTPKPSVVSEPIQVATKKPLRLTVPNPVTNLEDILDTIDVPENETMTALQKNNYTVNQMDHHTYYNSTIFIDKTLTDSFWESFKNITHHAMLSTSHRRAITVQLTFDFPFYGNPIRNITVATGGFLYTGEYVHSWLAATQYIAPLMANFDTSITNESLVRYYDNGTAFTVIWDKVPLQDRPENGTFTFSTTLHKNGDIVFAYFNVPFLIETIQDDKHPVKVGLSDAYIIDKVVFFSRRKTIFEYHRVNFGSQDINNSTIIYLTALPTCLSYTDCEACATHSTSFQCSWCPIVNRCSTGTDRKRQDWLQKSCDRSTINTKALCPALGQTGNNAAAQKTANNTSDVTEPNEHDVTNSSSNQSNSVHGLDPLEPPVSVPTFNKANMASSKQDDHQTKSFGLVLGFMVPICLVMSILVWVLYAYRNPHTKSGQLLIQYRPSQWSWKRGEARYTAATIHM